MAHPAVRKCTPPRQNRKDPELLRENQIETEQNENAIESDWQKTNSYFSRKPFSPVFGNDLNEVFERRAGSDPNRPLYCTQGVGHELTFRFRAEVYAYAPKRHQVDYAFGRPLWRAYLLYRTTTNGTLLDPQSDHGAGNATTSPR